MSSMSTKLATGFATLFMAGMASAALYYVPITFTNYTRDEALTNFPVLLRFTNNVGGSGFSYGAFSSTNGYDLQFWTNVTQTGSNLCYEIEQWKTNGHLLSG